MNTINETEELFCDVVMKGGITSGIVYPRAIGELAKAYTLKNVGGTSAGAIAAALAAAAEYRRRAEKTTKGFDELNQIPAQLSDGAIEKLFQPQLHTWSLYKFALAFVGSSHWLLKGVKVAILLFAFPATWLGALLGIAALIYMYFYLALRLPWYLWLLLVLSLVSLALLLALLNIVVQALCAIPANMYGLCCGSGSKSKNKPLTDWLADRLKLVANKDLLTFNDLWSAERKERSVDDDRVVNLEMMTTNLTFGRPYRIPFTEDETHLFYFRESEFRKLFPKEVVDHLKAAKPYGRSDEKDWSQLGPDYHPFPTGKDLPILVATRMSLSFPVLISAVPLYTFDSTLRKIKRCLFSDGGISSNFPIHFFDAPVPTWPTFGITLSSSVVADKSNADESQMVSLCDCNSPSDEEDWNRFDDHWWRLGGFLGAIVTTMEDWRDQTQARVPGYRDRIATIYLQRDEGGLNLKMPSEVVAALSKRGAEAGTRLRQRFNPREGDGSGLDWENQRWIRYRSFMGVFAAMLANFKRNYEYPQVRGVLSYDEMVSNGGIRGTTGHCGPNDKSPFTTTQTSDARAKTEELRNLWSAEPSPAGTFAEGAPKPSADFVIRPKV
jgi:predicted acylesterase/phospholipase RssA